MKFDPNKQVESRLNLIPVPPFNLGLVEIDSIEVKDYEVLVIDENGKESTSEFKGVVVPRINVTWRNHKTTELEDRFHTLSFGVVYNVQNNGTPMPKSLIEANYKDIFDPLKHIYDSYKNCVNYKPIVKFPDVDEMAVPEVRAKQMREFFNTFVTAFNGKDGKAVFVDKDGNKIISWLKILAGYKDPSKYETPKYVGQGFTEVAVKTDKGWKKPIIEVKPNETTTLSGKSSKKASDVNINTSQSELDHTLLELLKQNNAT